MKINTKKTKVMKISKDKETSISIIIDGEEIEQVKEFCYLGCLNSSEKNSNGKGGIYKKERFTKRRIK